MRNSRIIEAINYYSQLDKPGYAILLTGEWGAGKTHLITNNIKSYNYIYVSLFGLSSLDDIYASVYNAMHPRKGRAKNITSNFKDVEVGFGGFTMGLGSVTNGLANSIMRENVENNKIIVFDDLERSCIKPDQILGAINKYVEHHGCRVIAIAHDEKFGSKLTETKEKIIGLTLKVVPDIPETFKTFTKDFRFNPLIKVFDSNFINIFLASECKSLRILKHTLEDCVRLFEGLDIEIKNNREATLETMSLFLALDIEVRSGKLKTDDLKERKDQIAKYRLSQIRLNNKKDDIEEVVPNIYVASQKYNPIELGSHILSDEDLINTLMNGHYDFRSINKSVLSSSLFSEKKGIPTWRVLYDLDELDDDIINASLEKFHDEIKSRHYTAIGEILHAFHLMFLMSSISESSLSFEEVEIECKKYIDDLFENDRLPSLKEDNFFIAPFNDSYGSFGFWLLDSYREKMKEIRAYILNQQENVFIKNQPKISNSLLDYLENDPTKFCTLISYDYNSKGEYLENDILSSISARDFVNTWLSAPRKHWSLVRNALEYRYSAGRLTNSLASEQEWLEKVITELSLKIKNSSGFESYRLERLLPRELMSALNIII
ncbi:P-loop NTPase fold protein [Buttiauxella agrestis]|uniref:P-loop NTPase fold protein n=1 Tax=Buttiauxella agrestis TaxID=82977 RepID=UPI00155FC8AD|nr:P-loop NTPase fold protein [Buttiauxella agrestis]BCG10876.1 hypothetical protein BADSM9389_35660 [Buttiauxella agrestis]